MIQKIRERLRIRRIVAIHSRPTHMRTRRPSWAPVPLLTELRLLMWDQKNPAGRDFSRLIFLRTGILFQILRVLFIAGV